MQGRHVTVERYVLLAEPRTCELYAAPDAVLRYGEPAAEEKEKDEMKKAEKPQDVVLTDETQYDEGKTGKICNMTVEQLVRETNQLMVRAFLRLQPYFLQGKCARRCAR